MFKNSFGYLVKEGLHNIRANRQMSVASIGVLIACMVLIGGALLLSLNINSLMGYVESFNEVVVWIDDDLGSAGTERLKAEIDDLPNIASKQYISKEDALKELSDTLGSQSFLEGFEQYADENPLPASFRLKVNSLENLPETVKTLESLSGVESVESSNEVATTLVGIKTAIHVAGLTIVAILMVVSIIIIANTVRVTIFNRRREINIMKYVGATNAFIRFPFWWRAWSLDSFPPSLPLGCCGWAPTSCISGWGNRPAAGCSWPTRASFPLSPSPRRCCWALWRRGCCSVWWAALSSSANISKYDAGKRPLYTHYVKGDFLF